jgi:hypothetical protein
MAVINKTELDAQGGIGYWDICGGRFEVWDRGDGIAEVSPTGVVGVTTKEQIHAGPIGFVHGDRQPDQDETGYLETASAFPGVFQISGENFVDVESIEALEAFLTTN